MLYTGKGDNGTTKTFGCDQRISKSSAIAEALGSLDETNSFLGFVKIKAEGFDFKIGEKQESLKSIVHKVQESLFIVQAEIAGSEKRINQDKIKEAESIINWIEKELPPIKTFFISGGSELASATDFSRTLARRAERRIVSVSEEGVVKINAEVLSYMNRLSSLLYALTRYVNFKMGDEEVPPSYK